MTCVSDPHADLKLLLIVVCTLQVLRAHGGTPLHLAISLDAPKATEALLEHGASLITVWQVRCCQRMQH